MEWIPTPTELTVQVTVNPVVEVYRPVHLSRHGIGVGVGAMYQIATVHKVSYYYVLVLIAKTNLLSV